MNARWLVAKMFYALSGFVWAAVVVGVSHGMAVVTLVAALLALGLWRIGDLALKDAA